MLRSALPGLLGFLFFCSMQVKVSSQTLYITRSSQLSNRTPSVHKVADDDFVPDTLTADDDDDAEDEPTKKSGQEATHRVGESVSSKRLSGSLSPPDSQRNSLEKSNYGHRRLLKDAAHTLGVPTLAFSSANNRYTATPQGALPQQSSQTFVSRSLPSSTAASRVAQETQIGPAVEEEKVRKTTRNLVKWLRNRLRKRLEDVASLEEKCDVEKKLLTRLNETIQAESSERQVEIKMKLESQNEIKVVRQHFHEPDREVRAVRAENSHLVDQLAHLKKMYDALAVVRKEMEDRLVSAGFTHWLEKRGKEYMPATAVGVLSKSARILDPVSRGLEEVVKLDELFSSGVESVVPISERSLVSKILRDVALLIPVVPVAMLMWRINKISHRLSVLHLIMYISIIFVIESALIFGISVCIGAEAIRELQKSYDMFVVTGVFVNVLLYIVMLILQVLVTALRTSKSELMQSLLSLAVGYHFFETVFQPVVVSRPPTTNIVAHSIYAFNFTLIAFEKKAALRLGTRFDKHLNTFLLALERWVCETLQAMKDLFADTMPDISDDDTTSTCTDVPALSPHDTFLREVETVEATPTHRKETDVEELAKAMNVSRGYGRWTSGRTDHRATQSRPGFRGTRWYRTNPRMAVMQPGSQMRARKDEKSADTGVLEAFNSHKE